MNRTLGAFLVAVAFWQCALYALWRPGAANSDWILLMDPRMGLAFWGMAMHVGSPPFLASWASAVLLAAVGAALWRSGGWSRTYLLVEAALSVPTIAAIVLWGSEQMDAHLLIAVGVFGVVSVGPVLCGMRIMKEAA